ncbi:MAG TPA: KH domain-containing protein [Anaerolineae bacterium]|nr:KH domain-containing protein [Anaerolineae bacterium]HID83662.1 KH domain-containing protein [Anaerolineales bacterium]HIQ07912.1 KH domain-containing protein [Anaerolineaceae bacterium]
MKELVEYIARSLVDDPTEVSVRKVQRGNLLVLELQVAQEDMGRVIGKKGRVANAMRTLLEIAAARSGKRVRLEVVEPQ